MYAKYQKRTINCIKSTTTTMYSRERERERHRKFRNCSNNMTMHSSEKNASHSAKEKHEKIAIEFFLI